MTGIDVRVFPQHPGAFVRARARGEPDTEALPTLSPVAFGFAGLDELGSLTFDVVAARGDGLVVTGVDETGPYIDEDGVAPGDEAIVALDSGGNLAFSQEE